MRGSGMERGGSVARVAGDGAARRGSRFTVGGAGLSSWSRLPPRRVEHGGHVFTAEAEQLTDRVRGNGESGHHEGGADEAEDRQPEGGFGRPAGVEELWVAEEPAGEQPGGDRKSTRLNSSHSQISYAVFCLKKKKKHTQQVCMESW